jgi:hypothetical protein
MAGLGLFYQKSAPALWRGGVNFFCAWLFCAKCSRWFRDVPDGFSHKIKRFTSKTCFGAQAGCGDVTSPCKNLVKIHQRLTSIGRRFRSPFFLCQMQNLKAVAMGVVAAIAFWPHRPNPAIAPPPPPQEAVAPTGALVLPPGDRKSKKLGPRAMAITTARPWAQNTQKRAAPGNPERPFSPKPPPAVF